METVASAAEHAAIEASETPAAIDTAVAACAATLAAVPLP